jgi:hypothetical protein
MLMKVALKTIIRIPGLPTEVEMEEGTIREVLLKAFASTHFAGEIIEPETGALKQDGLWDVRLNGVPCYSLPQDLDSPVHEGDTVSFSFLPLGGG